MVIFGCLLLFAFGLCTVWIDRADEDKTKFQTMPVHVRELE